MDAPVEIVDYDPRWPQVFASLSDRITAEVGGLAQRVEHVGSTAVPGLAAKPIIDLAVVIATRDDLPAVVASFQAIGYRHRGDLGISGREAFAWPPDSPPHHLYVCAADNENLARVLAFRDFLRTHPSTAQAYATLKRSLAHRFRTDRAAYTSAKTAFIDDVVAKALSEPSGRDG
ncbi:GrpB family protein [Amycolatopsis sp. La24]|uniref:GrpB family protein n=1 Tax=Amycolatopsis sp. La24 TaxID=3028304 RepID=UPI0023B12614|nr:GrpB family protein [Amycolatopsis sp. La24]